MQNHAVLPVLDSAFSILAFCIVDCPSRALRLASGASALTITSSAPRQRIFVAGSPIELAVNDTHGDVGYQVMDYFGRKIASGTASNTVRLPGPSSPVGMSSRAQTPQDRPRPRSAWVMDRGTAPLPEDGPCLR